MTLPVIAIAGLSGVGKTTLLARVRSGVKVQVLRASALIREGRAQQGDTLASDTLRQRNIDENQQFLLRGFEGRADATADIIALDCHTVIELANETKLIEPDVFAGLRLSAMIFLKDDPIRIAARRAADTGRQRPATSPDRLPAVQAEAEQQARAICAALGIPLTVIAPDDDAVVAKIFQSLAAT
jgi:adenylate kinase